MGLILLWSDAGEVDELKGSVGFAAPGVTFPTAVVDEALPACPRSGPDDQPDTSQPCGTVTVILDKGVDEGTWATIEVAPEVSEASLEPEDRRGPADAGVRGPAGDPVVLRDRALLHVVLLGGVFVVVVLVIARLRGLIALIGVGVAGLVFGGFAIPARLAGQSPVPVALVIATLIMYVVLYTTHGVSLQTSAALAGWC